MRILVTGAGGFLGADLVDDLRMSGHQVRRLVSRVSMVKDDDGNVIVGDIRDASCVRSAMIGCDRVVHLAGKAHALDDEGVSEADYQSVNVEGTRQLLEEAKAAGVRKFVFASSVKVFGETTLGCIDEAAPAVPRSPYARSKWSAEQLVASFASGALRTVSFRLPLVYGPTEKGNLFRMIAAIDRGRFPPLPRVPALRSMLHVKNFVLAVRAALDVDTFPKPVYVIADATPYSISEIYDRLREGLGRQPPVCRVPAWALSFGAKCGDLLQVLTRRPFPFSSSTWEKLMGQACYSPEAAMRELHYRPLYTFEQAVPDLISHYRRSLA
jgi:nucleoside-diphosphate-sugar epimerase